MTYPVDVYVDSAGETFRAGQTDQAKKRGGGNGNRTKHGRPLVWAGGWYGCQMSYQPYVRAVIKAMNEAEAIEAAKAGRPPKPSDWA